MPLHDDFLSKPYELAGRTIDPLAGTAEYKGRKRAMRRKQLEVLALLASADGKVVARSAFIEWVWENNALIGDSGLTDTISDLRHSLDDSQRDHPLIRTIPRRGYQLSAAARLIEDTKPAAFEVGNAIPGKADWHLRQLLGASGVSQTWLAEGPDGEQRLFRFCRDEQHLKLLRREAALLRLLQALADRPDLVRIHGWQFDEPPYFLELEHLPLGSLTRYSAAIGGLVAVAHDERRRWMAAITTALDAVHQAGIVHRNLGANSVFVANDGGRLRLKLGEFGLGELTDRSRLESLQISAAGLTLPGYLAVGDAVYLAPERLRGEAATAASDVYALGVLLYQLAIGDTRRAPMEAWETAIEPVPLRTLIAACIDPEPAQRPTAARVLEQLAALDAPAPGNDEAPAALPLAARVTDPIVAQPSHHVDVKAGQTIGPYRIVEKLGQGGMGVVYLAEQREPVQRQVALKVILAGMDTMDVLARFEAERQALALMNHVNVAAVFEAGSSATGRPYFAMEYVPGLDITAHCDERELDFRQRIELFLQVCDGVLHAHQKGIIHRDIKPSNLLIKSAQGQPATAKIIDFGVAKSLQRKLGRLTAHTHLGSFVGTPSYSSPEQISGQSAHIDTRTDIYSLGVVLYEMLAGVTPYSEEALAGQSPLELTKLLRSHVPPPLLKRFISLEASAEAEIAGRRKMTVAQMKQALGSDLSWIVAKCLEHDPAERYASVLELEKDLRRWLENRPVEARPISFTYRVRKLIRRNRASVAVGALVAFALLSTTTAAIVGFVRTERALAEARRSAEEATMASSFLANQINGFRPANMGPQLRAFLLEEINAHGEQLGLADDQQALVEKWLKGANFSDVSIKQLDGSFFQPALVAIASDYKDAPLLQATLWDSIGNSLGVVGQFDKSAETIGLALSARITHLGELDPLTLETHRRRGYARLRLGQMTEAEADFRSAYDGMRRQLGELHPNTLMSLNALANCLLNQDRSEPVIALLSPIVAMRSPSEAVEALILRAEFFLSYAHYLSGQLDQASDFGSRALEGQRKLLGREHGETIDTMGVLATVLGAKGEFQLAETYNREVYELTLKAHGSRHPDTLIAKANLTFSLSQTGKLAQAIELQRQLISESSEVQGNRHPVTLIMRRNLGVWLGRAGQFAEAESVLREALQALRETSGDDAPQTLGVLHHLGRVLAQDAEKMSEAETTLRQALQGREAVRGPDHLETLDTKFELATLLDRKGALQEAERLAEQSVEGRTKRSGNKHQETKDAVALLEKIRERRRGL